MPVCKADLKLKDVRLRFSFWAHNVIKHISPLCCNPNDLPTVHKIIIMHTLPKELLKIGAECTSNGLHRKFHLEIMYFSLTLICGYKKTY